MAIDLRPDEMHARLYDSDEVTAAMRAAEAWSLRVAGAYLVNHANMMSVEDGDMAKQLGDVLMKISDARMEYLGSPAYQTTLEETVSAGCFDVLSRFYNDPSTVHPVVVTKSLNTILAALTHIDDVTARAGFLHPTRLESILARGTT